MSIKKEILSTPSISVQDSFSVRLIGTQTIKCHEMRYNATQCLSVVCVLCEFR